MTAPKPVVRTWIVTVVFVVLVLVGLGFVVSAPPAKYHPQPLSPVAVKIADLIRSHPEEWQSGAFDGELTNVRRGITIDFGFRQNFGELKDGRSISVRVDAVGLPGFDPDKENAFLRGVVEVPSANQTVIYEQAKLWYSGNLETQKRIKATEEAAAIKKVLDQPL
jgi:hypothetical protein